MLMVSCFCKNEITLFIYFLSIRTSSTSRFSESYWNARSANIWMIDFFQWSSFSIGNLFTTRCTSCGFIEENNDSPICEALRHRGYIHVYLLLLIALKYIRLPNENGPEIAVTDLPSCRQCQSLVRPHVVWFGESLWPDVLEKIDEEISRCDLFLVVCLSFFSVSLVSIRSIEGGNISHCLSGRILCFDCRKLGYSRSWSQYWINSFYICLDVSFLHHFDISNVCL
jgi:hypothetical protein